MSTNAPRRPRANKGKCTFQIVASQFNSQYVRGLVDHAEKELRSLASSAAISIHRVPGSFEIPVVVRELARKKKDGEHAKRRFSIISGATFNVVKDRRKLTIFGSSARQQPGFANLRSRSSKEWSSIYRKSTNGFAVIARIMNFEGSQRLIATCFAWRSTKCFIETTYRRSSRLTKQLNWQKCMVAANRVVSSTAFLIA